MAKKVAPLSKEAKAVYEVLKNAEKPLTLAELAKKVEGLNSAHLTALKNRGLVGAEKVTKEVTVVQKREVNEYTVTDGVELTEED